MKSSESSDTNINLALRPRIFLCAVALMLVGAATIALGHHQRGAPPAPSRLDGAQSKTQTITPIPFEEMNGDRAYTASGVVPLADSRFLFCDNNSGDALFELDLAEDGRKKGRLTRRPLPGLAPKGIADMEAMTLAEEKGRRFIFVTSSLSAKKTKDGQSLKVPPSGLLRVTVNSDDSLSAENIPGF